MTLSISFCWSFQVKELSGKVNLDEKFDGSINPQHAGITPLALACALNKVDMVKVLISIRSQIFRTT